MHCTQLAATWHSSGLCVCCTASDVAEKVDAKQSGWQTRCTHCSSVFDVPSWHDPLNVSFEWHGHRVQGAVIQTRVLGAMFTHEVGRKIVNMLNACVECLAGSTLRTVALLSFSDVQQYWYLTSFSSGLPALTSSDLVSHVRSKWLACCCLLRTGTSHFSQAVCLLAPHASSGPAAS